MNNIIFWCERDYFCSNNQRRSMFSKKKWMKVKQIQLTKIVTFIDYLIRDLSTNRIQIKKFLADLEFQIRKSQIKYQLASQKYSYWDDLDQINNVNQICDEQYNFLVRTRLLLQQQLAAFDVLEKKVDESKVNLVDENCNVYRLVQGIVEDCMAFSVEKNSTSPIVNISGEKDVCISTVDSYVFFLTVEVLKNGMQAVIRRYGAWDVDEADPIQFKIQRSKNFLTMQIIDTGGGVPQNVLKNMQNYYYTTTLPRDPKYGYSRDHGSQMEGIGVGIPLTKLYCRLMGGNVEWEVERENQQTIVTIQLPVNGFQF
eukprot:TRINITY_DN29054_c0_g1_i2.p1 TRINITY_DN29054_c0_g1~~TRINITY_DN29054_c0_g1_i2.p1  ORF type:complete len:313 (-),score=35.95 TRINITY_DN29054_c0_g1_i2:274-1212(-)